MKNNPILSVIIISALTAIVVVVALKFLGYENPTVIGGGAAGGLAGALSTKLFGKKS